jgi:hypothetical protein
MLRWLESQGYDLTYATNMDVHENPNQLLQHRVFLSVGHDEYWSEEMRDGVEQARDAGINLAFFSANAAYWRVRFEPSGNGEPNRTMVCYKEAIVGDPIAPTYLWRGPENNRPENALMGIMATGGNYLGLGFDYTVADSSHPLFSNTGLNNGDNLDRLVGFEWDAIVNNGVTPPGLEILSESPVNTLGALPGLPPGQDLSVSHSVRYVDGSGAVVFSAGSMQWMWGLDSTGVTQDYYSGPPVSLVDPRAAQFAVNLFADMGARPLSPSPGLVVP